MASESPTQDAPARLTFHGDLAEILRCRNDNGLVLYPVTRRASVKDAIEALGPPHPCVGRILSHEGELDFGHLLLPGDVLDVLPHPCPRNVLEADTLRPDPLGELRFLADANVGKLAQRMRLLGFDTAYARSADDAAIAAQAYDEARIVLSKDRGLLKRSSVVFAHLVRSEEPDAQLVEVTAAFGLRPPFAVFSRCLRCNALLTPVSKQAVLHRLEPLTKRHYEEFMRCPGCEKVYWAGSHHEKLHQRLARLGMV